MTVAGSDSGAGAGIQADMLSIASQGVFATCAIAAMTAQNPGGVRAVQPSSAQFLAEQLESVCEYFKPAAAKCGMLFSAELAEVAARFFKSRPEIRLVVDPVMISTSGAKLLQPDAAKILVEKLIPLAELATPNLDEAQFILGIDKISARNLEEAALGLSQHLNTSVLLKGGHLQGDEIVDALAVKNSGEVLVFKSERILNVDTHGSGCTLSAAIAARFALGEDLVLSVKNAREYLLRGMKNPLRVAGKNFINHLA